MGGEFFLSFLRFGERCGVGGEREEEEMEWGGRRGGRSGRRSGVEEVLLGERGWGVWFWREGEGLGRGERVGVSGVIWRGGGRRKGRFFLSVFGERGGMFGVFVFFLVEGR